MNNTITAEFVFDLGDLVQDRITGLKGIAVSRVEHLYGCARYWLQPQEHKDGKPVEGFWIDEPQLVLIQKRFIEPVSTKSTLQTTEKPLERKPGGFDLPTSVSSKPRK